MKLLKHEILISFYGIETRKNKQCITDQSEYERFEISFILPLVTPHAPATHRPLFPPPANQGPGYT